MIGIISSCDCDHVKRIVCNRKYINLSKPLATNKSIYCLMPICCKCINLCTVITKSGGFTTVQILSESYQNWKLEVYREFFTRGVYPRIHLYSGYALKILINPPFPCFEDRGERSPIFPFVSSLHSIMKNWVHFISLMGIGTA